MAAIYFLFLFFSAFFAFVKPDADVDHLLCPNGKGFHPHPLNCSKFYTCQGSQAVVFQCLDDEEWDVKSERCACPSIAQCSCKGDSGSTTSNPATDQTDYQSDYTTLKCEENERYPDPLNCSDYFVCQNGELVNRTCPFNSQFDVDLKCCVVIPLAHCYQSSTTAVDYSTDLPQTTTSGEDPCHGNEFYPCPWDCSKYFHCSNSFLYLKDCPAGLQWDAKTDRCEWPIIAQCTESTISYPESYTTPAPRSTSGYIPVYNPCLGNEFYPCPWDCSKFFHCDGTIAYLKDCPANLEWDTKSNRCEWPIIAQCNESPVTFPDSHTVPSDVTVSEIPEYNPCHGKEFYPCPWDCSKFYHCDGFTPYLMDCPSGLEWDTKLNRCEWPIIAKCKVIVGK